MTTPGSSHRPKNSILALLLAAAACGTPTGYATPTVGRMRGLRTAPSQLDRSDEARALLGPWADGALERIRVAE